MESCANRYDLGEVGQGHGHAQDLGKRVLLFAKFARGCAVDTMDHRFIDSDHCSSSRLAHVDVNTSRKQIAV